MAKRLDGRVALVTGASRGIGRAIGIVLAAEGAMVILVGRDMRMLEETAERAEAAGGAVEIVDCELTKERCVKDLAEFVAERPGCLDILVNNAGVAHSAEFERTTTKDFEYCWRVNALAPFILTRELLPLLKRSPNACIVNIASVVGIKGYPLQSAYTSSKHALRGMSISLAEELRDTNIRVHVICPGGVDTDLVTQVRPDIGKEDLIKPEEVAEIVLYLVTQKGNAVVDEIRVRRRKAGPWY